MFLLKTRKLVQLPVVLFLSLGLVACSSDEQLEENLENYPEEITNGVNASLNGGDNFGGEVNNFGGGGEGEFAEGEAVNNFADNEFGEGDEDFAANNANFNSAEGDEFAENFSNEGNFGFNNEGGNNFGFNNEGGDNFADNAMLNETAESLLVDASSNLAPAGNEAQPGADLALADVPAADAAMAATPEAPAFNPQPGDRGSVRYAIERLNVLSAPEGDVVKVMDRGDHNLVWEDGEWLRNSG
jgi:hypothetical protein